MGNRAVIAFGSVMEPKTIGIYLHWNGGVESVNAFLKAAKDLGVRDPMQDNYGIARVAQIIGNFFGGTTSIGLDVVSNLDTDNLDNGTFEIGEDFKIVKRVHSKNSDMESINEELYQSIMDAEKERFSK